MKSTVRVTKWVAGGLEALLGIPVLGASIIIGLVWTPLAIMLVFHIVNLVLSKNEDLPVAGSILGQTNLEIRFRKASECVDSIRNVSPAMYD